MEREPISKTLSRFKPEKFVFVISQDENGPCGMVAAWETRVSSNPPLYAVSLSKKGNTYKVIQKSKKFVIAVPNKALEKEVCYFGSNHGDEVDKFKETNIEMEKAEKIKVPLIKKATFNFECKLVKEVEVGDHVLIIGEVIVAHYNKGEKILLNYGKVGGERHFIEMPTKPK